METLDEILGAFEQALELERELGTRTVECDRALLTPLRPAAPAAPKPAPQVETPPPTLQTPVSSRPTSPSPPPPRPPQPALPSQPSHPSHPSHPSQPSSLVDFAFIAAQIPQGAAAELLAKMVAAMGYTMTQVTVVAAATAAQIKPRARVYVVLGSDAFRVFAPGQRAALGLWTEVVGVPTVVTYSPARILSYFGADPEGLNKAKRQIWSDLKSALARIGKTPPRR